ncbi:sensor histidine kinase [Schumannella luteola]
MSTAATARSAEKALERMRRYTTASFVGIVVVFVAMGLVQLVGVDLSPLSYWISVAGLLVSGVTAGYVVYHWEERSPGWIETAALGLCSASWVATALVRGTPGVALVVALAIGTVVARDREHRTRRAIIGAIVLFGPIGVGTLVHPGQNWVPWLIVTGVSYVLAVGLAMFTIYTWGLYLEIDAARRGAAALAVAQERYRFAADLHDIQGHTLHVIRLKTRLASRLLDADPTAARQHLAEAESLIEETLANTRSLAFGDREVALAAELANAQELFSAAGIRCTVDGDAAGSRADELFGLTLRETTTNILRHSQARSVSIAIEPGRLEIVNDGSPDSSRPPSGLGRLAERFEAAGGTLRTRSGDGSFTTTAVIP